VTYPGVQACGCSRAEPRLHRMWQRTLPARRPLLLARPRLLARPLLSAALLCSLVSLSACDDADVTPSVCPVLPSECPAVVPSYANEVAPIIATHCGQCHTREDISGPWPLDDPTDVADWATQIQLDLSECLMPPRETDAPLSDADRETLHTWLMCGAPVN
jgi:uncharacterized membrane protein